MHDDDRRRRNAETMRTWFRLQQEMNLDAWLELWAEDASQSIPYAPAGLPRAITGKRTLTELYRSLFTNFKEINIRDLVIDPLHDPDRVLVRWHTHAPLTNGETYENDLIGVFEFDADGRIRHLTEYLDPTRVNIGG
ncbi:MULTISPECIES: nuclear transport factor 2 family protein [Catenuloplanes]|uniref:Ketosteroid isomerase-like protein n=1 Tax=Catenuloplanes niger TaxID=587534 RepID=A0AAE3ZZ99_9ACTN|nr:nuclear transport factor 2 family protein [Catenuloplanes niger]MDR7327576.1 ketosteroid isomerase-like protein [Catenuloplanes niger]